LTEIWSFDFTMTDQYRIERLNGRFAVFRNSDGKKVSDHASMSDALWRLDSLRPKHKRQGQAGSDVQNT
jgi:hypothetical protein